MNAVEQVRANLERAFAQRVTVQHQHEQAAVRYAMGERWFHVPNEEFETRLPVHIAEAIVKEWKK